MEPRSLAFIPDRLKTEDICIEAVGRDAYTLEYVFDYIMTQKICNEAMCKNPAVFFLVPDRSKTQKMCIKALEVDPWQLKDVPDQYKTLEMCDDAYGETRILCSLFLIGLLPNDKQMYGLVMIIGVMMMRLLNGTMVTKNGRHRKHKLKKS